MVGNGRAVAGRSVLQVSCLWLVVSLASWSSRSLSSGVRTVEVSESVRGKCPRKTSVRRTVVSSYQCNGANVRCPRPVPYRQSVQAYEQARQMLVSCPLVLYRRTVLSHHRDQANVVGVICVPQRPLCRCSRTASQRVSLAWLARLAVYAPEETSCDHSSTRSLLIAP